jgi:hypothetical protein
MSKSKKKKRPTKERTKKRKISAKEQFGKVFPRLAAAGLMLVEFGKCRKFIEHYLTIVMKRAGVVSADPLDFIDAEGELREELTSYAEIYYPNQVTRDPQLSLVRGLAVDEFKKVKEGREAGGGAGSEAEASISPDKLKPHVLEVYENLPRIGGKLKPGQVLKDRPLNAHGKIMWKAVQAVDLQFDTKSKQELLVDHYEDLRKAALAKTKRPFKRAIQGALLYYVKVRMGMPLVLRRRKCPWDQLPPLLRSCLKIHKGLSRRSIKRVMAM